MAGLRIGLVYDLKDDYLAAGFTPAAVMEFDGLDTIIGLEDALVALGHAPERIGRGVEFARRLVAGERWDLIFNIAEGISGRSREAQVPALCELFNQPYTFADPLSCALTLDKAMAKRMVRDHGLATAPFAIVARVEDAAGVALAVPLFAKPVAEGSSKGVTGRSLVTDPADLAGVCADLITRFGQPVLVESFLPGREVTVGLIGDGDGLRVVAVLEVIFTARAETRAYTALNKDEYVDRMEYRLVTGEPLADQAGRLALACAAALGCRDAARVDIRCDATGAPNFIEVNPLPGINLVRSDLPIMARMAGMSYPELIGAIISSARRRVGL